VLEAHWESELSPEERAARGAAMIDVDAEVFKCPACWAEFPRAARCPECGLNLAR